MLRRSKCAYVLRLMTEQVLAGKIGLVFGVANKRSIAWAIAKAWAAAGARLISVGQARHLLPTRLLSREPL